MTADSPSKDSVLRACRRAHRDWPQYLADRPAPAEKAFLALTEQEREEAIAAIPAYVEACRSAKPKLNVGSFGVYLSEKRWLRLADMGIVAVAANAKPLLVPPTGKAGMAMRLAEMFKPMVPEGAWPAASVFIRAQIDQGGEKGQAYFMDRCKVYGWPKVKEMDNRASVLSTEEMRVASTDFVSVEIDGDVGQAWKRLHDRMRLPWLRSDIRYAYFPPLPEGEDDLDKAVAAAFWGFKERIKGHVDAA